MTSNLILKWFDNCLVIEGNISDDLLEKLSYWHRVYTQKNNKADIKNEKRVLYTQKNNNTLITFSGYKDLIVNFCKQKNINYTLKDRRKKLPEPKIHDALPILKSYQQSPFIEAITQDKAGCLALATRFGKTYIMMAYCIAYSGCKILLAAPGVDLLGQLVKDFQAAFPNKKIQGVFTESPAKNVEDPDIIISSFESLHLCDKNIDLMLIDEPHAAVTQERSVEINNFPARKIGFGATLKNRFDQADTLIEGIIGPVLTKRDYKDSLKVGAVCPIKAYMVKYVFDDFDVKERNSAYKKLVYQNQEFIQLVADILNNYVPADWQSLIFINNQKQADFYKNHINNAHIGMDKLFKTKKHRNEFMANMVNNEIKRCICSNIYNQGITFPDLQLVVNCAGGGKSTSSVQRPGRLAQIRPNKNAGYVVDFLFECKQANTKDKSELLGESGWKYVVNDSINRYKVYKDTGYEVEIVSDPSSLVFN